MYLNRNWDDPICIANTSTVWNFKLFLVKISIFLFTLSAQVALTKMSLDIFFCLFENKENSCLLEKLSETIWSFLLQSWLLLAQQQQQLGPCSCVQCSHAQSHHKHYSIWSPQLSSARLPGPDQEGVWGDSPAPLLQLLASQSMKTNLTPVTVTNKYFLHHHSTPTLVILYTVRDRCNVKNDISNYFVFYGLGESF